MNESPVNLTEVKKMIGDNLDLFSSLVDIFTEESVGQMDSVENAIINKDSVSLDNSAHSFKSSLATLGAFEASSLAAQLEIIGKAGGIDDSVDIVVKLKLEYEKVISYFKSGQWQKDWDTVR